MHTASHWERSHPFVACEQQQQQPHSYYAIFIAPGIPTTAIVRRSRIVVFSSFPTSPFRCSTWLMWSYSHAWMCSWVSQCLGRPFLWGNFSLWNGVGIYAKKIWENGVFFTIVYRPHFGWPGWVAFEGRGVVSIDFHDLSFCVSFLTFCWSEFEGWKFWISTSIPPRVAWMFHPPTNPSDIFVGS